MFGSRGLYGRATRSAAVMLLCAAAFSAAGAEFPKPYSPPCVERENVFEFTQKPTCRYLGNDKYEITFAVKGYCDVTVAVVDPDPKKELVPGRGVVVRHLASGVLGRNAPAPFQKNSLTQKIYWNGRDDLSHYPMNPGKLRVRVMLGLKVEYDKPLGGTSPYNLPGRVWGIAADADGVYVFARGTGSGRPVRLRKFDHDGNYVRTLVPPPADQPAEKLGGYGFVEYEPGRRALQGVRLMETVARHGFWLPDVNGAGEIVGVVDCRPALSNGRLYFCNPGIGYFFRKNSLLFNIRTDGTTDPEGLRGTIFGPFERFQNKHCYPRLAASPDGKRIYFVGIGGGSQGSTSGNAPAVVVIDPAGKEPTRVFCGDPKAPGADNRHLNFPTDVACDESGRVYIADGYNNRVQIFAPGGKLLKSLAVSKLAGLDVHRKTGALYVVHGAQRQGRTIGRLTKFSAFPELREEFHADGFAPSAFAVDSWTAKPRVWTAGREHRMGLGNAGRNASHGTGLTAPLVVWEETKTGLRKMKDFAAAAKKEDGAAYAGPRSGGSGRNNLVTCDPVRGTVYFNLGPIFDLRTGAPVGRFSKKNFRGAVLSEAQFDKQGYMHLAGAKGFGPTDDSGVVRLDPARAQPDKKGPGLLYAETPYDYGEEKIARWNNSWKGVLPLYNTDHQLYTWGLGVNMRGDVAVCVHVDYAPKMEAESYNTAFQGVLTRKAMGLWTGAWVSYAAWDKKLKELARKGEEIYYIKRRPGIPLTGGTIWTFDRYGELIKESAVVAGTRLNGVQIDEDRALYSVNSRFRLFNGRPFLAGRGGNYGGRVLDPANKQPYTGTYFKTPSSGALFLEQKAKIPLEQPPARPPDLAAPDVFGAWLPDRKPGAWVEGAEWLYAGASPIVPAHCDCPQMRVHLDWYKRSYVPEAYRHSVGVLDANGNLLLHVGRYGNFDSGFGPQSRVPVGGDGIAFTYLEFLSGTDDYLVFQDCGERAAVLKLDYHAEQTVPIGMK